MGNDFDHMFTILQCIYDMTSRLERQPDKSYLQFIIINDENLSHTYDTFLE